MPSRDISYQKQDRTFKCIIESIQIDTRHPPSSYFIVQALQHSYLYK